MKPKYNSGLSLIELIISVSIIAVLAAAGSISLARHKKTVQLDETASLLEVNISRAKTMAQAPPATDGNYKFFGVIFDKADRRYMLAARKDTGKFGSDQKILEEFKLEEGMSFGDISGIPNIDGNVDGPMFGVEEQGKIDNLTEDVAVKIIDSSETRIIKIYYPYGTVESQ